jgi:hypothetical protein
MESKEVIGLIENTEFFSLTDYSRLVKMKAKVDTGATRSSIDYSFAKKLGLIGSKDDFLSATEYFKKTNVRRKRNISFRKVWSAIGFDIRPVIYARLLIRGKIYKASFTISDRSKMKYKVLLGQNILKKGFLIDPNK